MANENNSESAPEAGSEEPDVSAEDVRDLLLAEEDPLNLAAISERLEISEETAEEHLDRLIQSGIAERKYRSPVKGGTVWVLRHPHLRIREPDEIAGEPPLSHKASFAGEPRDAEVGVEDVLKLLAEFDESPRYVAPNITATKLQVTTRHALDLLVELEQRGIADRVSRSGDGAKMFQLADSYSADGVKQLLGDPEPEPDPVDELNKALSN